MIGLESEKEIHILPMEERHIVELARLEAVCFSSPWSEEGLRAELQSETAVFSGGRAGRQGAGLRRNAYGLRGMLRG